MLDEFIAYLEKEVANHSIYVIGGQGQYGKDVTEKWIRYREQESQRNADRAVAFWKKQCAAGYGDVLGAFDCSGLGMYWIIKNGIYPSDLNANGMRSLCEVITREEVKRGDWLFEMNDNRATHIGYAISDKQAIECRGRDYGVCVTDINSRKWNYYGRPKAFKNEIENEVEEMIYDVAVKKGDKGDKVTALQNALIKNGYALTKYGADGDFGGETFNAVCDLQKNKGFVIDGIADREEIEAVGLTWHYKKEYEELLAELREIKQCAERIKEVVLNG